MRQLARACNVPGHFVRDRILVGWILAQPGPFNIIANQAIEATYAPYE